MIGYFIVLLVVIGIQFFLQMTLGSIGLPMITIELIVNLVIALIFSLFNYPGRKKDAFRDLMFHKRVFGYFIVFTLISLIFYGINYLL
jgi:hypothetical protein